MAEIVVDVDVDSIQSLAQSIAAAPASWQQSKAYIVIVPGDDGFGMIASGPPGHLALMLHYAAEQIEADFRAAHALNELPLPRRGH